MILMAAPAAAGQVELISKADPIPDTNHDSEPLSALSADGRYVAFRSLAPNLVAGQVTVKVGGNTFLRDRLEGTTVLVSHAAGSLTTTARSGPYFVDAEVQISADGRYVVFISTGKDLVPGEVNPDYVANLYLYDRVTRTNTLISHASGDPAATGNKDSSGAQISADGNYVAFSSEATNLVAGQVGPGSRLKAVFLYERSSGKLTLLSHRNGAPATTANNGSAGVSLSRDGGLVVFGSAGTDLVPGVTGENINAFLYQRSSGTLSLVTHAHGSPLTATGGYAPQISADGRWIAFRNSSDVFLQDRLSGQTRLVSHKSSSPSLGAGILRFSMSADGGVVTFDSSAADIVPGQVDTNGSLDLFAYSRATGITELVSHTAASRTTAPAHNGIYHWNLNGDGRLISYTSVAGDLVAHQTGKIQFNVFLYDRTSRATALVSHVESSLTTSANDDAGISGISADGGTVAFASLASDLGTINPNHFVSLFAYDRRSAEVTPLSNRDPGSPIVTPNGPSVPEAISADGRMVLFSSQATGLVPGQIDIPYSPSFFYNVQTLDIFLHDRSTGKTTLLSRSATSPLTAVGGYRPALSASGKFAAFVTYDPVPPNAPQAPRVSRVYLYDQAVDRLILASHSPGSPTDYEGNPDGPSLSDDGRYLAFNCTRCKVVPGMQASATVGQSDVFLYDRVTDTHTLVSHATGSPLRPGNGDSFGRISPDGRFVLVSSGASDLIAGQAGPAGFNLFLFDRTTGITTLVSHAPGDRTRAADGSTGSGPISADGRWILVSSSAPDLVPGQTGGSLEQGFANLFLHDRMTDTTTLVNHAGSSPLTPANQGTYAWSMSADGRWIVYSSTATDLIPGGSDTNEQADVFLYDRISGTTALVTHAEGSPTTADSLGGVEPKISADGSRIAFLTPGDRFGPAGPAIQAILQDRATEARIFAGTLFPTSPIHTVWNQIPLGIHLSASGRQFAFTSFLPYPQQDLNENWDAYLYDDSDPAGGPVPIPPCALLDRSLRSNVREALGAAGNCGVPATAKGYRVRVTVRQGTGQGNVRLYPGGITAPSIGILRFQRGQTVSASFDLPPATNAAGAVLPFVRGNGTVRVTVEVEGYFP